VTALRGALSATAIAPSSEFEARDPAPPSIDPPEEPAPRPLPRVSMLALIAANSIPLFGVLFGGWKLDEVMVLFWAESAVIGCYTLLKMAVVGKWRAPFLGLFLWRISAASWRSTFLSSTICSCAGALRAAPTPARWRRLPVCSRRYGPRSWRSY
jgi:hypothetical protein